MDNPKLMLCVACARDQRLLRGVCVHCSKSPWGCQNNIHNVSRAAEIHESVDSVENQLENASLSAESRADLRHLLGSLYEDLADVSTMKDSVATAPPAPVKAPPVQAAPAKTEPAKAEPAEKTPARTAAQDEVIMWDGGKLSGDIMSAGPGKLGFKTGKTVSVMSQSGIRAIVLRGMEEPDNLSASGESPLIIKTDGSSARGALVSATPRQFSFKTADGAVFTMSRTEVRAIVFPPSK